jgi:ABC-type amino acid transport substrate-binding protein
LLLGANYLLVSESVKTIPWTKDRVLAMELVDEMVEMPEIETRPNPAQLRDGENRLERIQRTGVLRVGYEPNNPPFCYRNASGKLVGFDVDLVQRLAFSLGVELRFVPYERETLKASFDADHFDLAISEIMSSVRNWGEYHETDSYLALNLALLVEDHRAKDFDTREELKAMAGVRLGAVEGMVNLRPGILRDIQLQIVPIEDPREFLEGEDTDVDAMIVSAESGTILTMSFPRFSIVIPRGVSLRVPIVFATRDRGELSRLVDSWIKLKREDGTIEKLYEHWVLGKELTKTKKRWSILRDLLGWVD